MNSSEYMHLSLAGLSVGDALGESFFGFPGTVSQRIERRELPSPPWRYTDDTEMAISIVEILEQHGRIEPDQLAQAFAKRYTPWRGYGAGAHRLLQSFQQGADWRVEAANLFGGTGSYGNGAAMRVAPLGAYLSAHLEGVCENARLSAQITHCHPEGIAGAIAVAIAAALAVKIGEGEQISSTRFLAQVIENVPESETRQGIVNAMKTPFSTAPQEVASQLGSGGRISAQDTVPFVLWCAALHLEDYEEAFWTTVSGLGDRDTICAMVGGIVALSARERGIPAAWIEAREPLQ